MKEPVFNRATHFSIVWAVMLAILTIVEWRSLDREPLAEQIFLPFIEREIGFSILDANSGTPVDTASGDLPAEDDERGLQTNVNIAFNGPLFLAYFFVPIVIFHAVGLLWSRLRPGA